MTRKGGCRRCRCLCLNNSLYTQQQQDYVLSISWLSGRGTGAHDHNLLTDEYALRDVKYGLELLYSKPNAFGVSK